MTRGVLGVLVLLLTWPALRGDDKPSTPKARYDALREEARQARQDFLKAFGAAKSPEERQKASKEDTARMTPFAVKFIALAANTPKEPAGLDALTWVVRNNVAEAVRAKALDLLIREHIESDQLAPICLSMRFRVDAPSVKFLRAVLAKNPNQQVKAEAALVLAQVLFSRARYAKLMKDRPESERSIANFAGEDAAAELKTADAAELTAASAAMYHEVADHYGADLSPERLDSACYRMGYSRDKTHETFLRTLLEKDKRREVQGVACLALAQCLKVQAEVMSDKDAKEAAKLRKECEELFTRAADKYGDVKRSFGGTVGDKAKSELFEIRYLCIGLPAPDIVGEDQDGQKFKLSDYKGKVVLLDFWSEF